jgi:hypothetical protein
MLILNVIQKSVTYEKNKLDNGNPFIYLVRACLNSHCDMLYMHNVTHTKNSQKQKIQQPLGSWQRPPMEGGVRSTSRNYLQRFSVFISTSSYVKLIDRIHKIAKNTHSWETTKNNFFEKTCLKAMAAMM